ncbi:galactose-3-O-sulfotransferase 2-like [Polypterus senegalus]|uniref:galactose-3-O-sulfotransferase 2-like n=1 Tax=Polypterus senegalus TaxID=55291 RepID=UPI0019666F8E|nr:galactose-3-O-sulfotransferase 2-like [Polypterus senegalus]
MEVAADSLDSVLVFISRHRAHELLDIFAHNVVKSEEAEYPSQHSHLHDVQPAFGPIRCHWAVDRFIDLPLEILQDLAVTEDASNLMRLQPTSESRMVSPSKQTNDRRKMEVWSCCRMPVQKISASMFTGTVVVALIILSVSFHMRHLGQINVFHRVSHRIKFHPHTSQSSQWKGSEVHPLQKNKSDEKQSPRSCQPKMNVMFLKTHKTASSTILNLLCRFGEKHGLTFALPTKYRFGYPKFFSSRSIKGFSQQDGRVYNIMCHHMRFKRPEVQKVMPADTFYFTILRNPVTMAESAYTYFKFLVPSFYRSASFVNFIAHPWMYYHPKIQNSYLARNLLWFDFGFDHNANFSLQEAQIGVAEIQQSFNLILLADYFDQSMVLLRDALCWSLDDIVTFRLNSRSSDARKHLSQAQEDQVKQWNAMDWYLYQSFNKTFWQKVESFGKSRMDQEVASLQARRKELENLCLLQVRKGGQSKTGQARILAYDLNLNLSLPDKEHCLRMILTEYQYTDLLHKKQFPRTESVPKQPVAKSIRRAPIQGFGVNIKDSVIRRLDRSKKELLRGHGQRTPH